MAKKAEGKKWQQKLLKFVGKSGDDSFVFKVAMLVAAAAALLVALFYLILSLLFLDKSFPNIILGGENVGALSRAELSTKIAELNNAAIAQPIILKNQDKTLEISRPTLEWSLDESATVDAVMQIGRSGNWASDAWQKIVSLFSRQEAIAVASFDSEILVGSIAAFADSVDQVAKDASAQYIGGKLVIEREQAGSVINREQLAESTEQMLLKLDHGTITAQRENQLPQILLGDESALSKEAEALTRELEIVWESGKRTVSKEQSKNLIGFVGRTTPDVADGSTLLTAAYTQEQIAQYLITLSESINQKAKDPVLVIKNGALAIAATSKGGRVVDVHSSTQLAYEKLVNTAPSEFVSIELIMTDQLPVINENNLSSLGIVERIGYGETSFAGSPANRTHNIKTGTTLLQSALIPPGGEFSTVKTLGAVDGTTGFLPELVIKNNRTTPEYGGGLCQVSTTLFRSVLNAGLPVLERQNHSYRVGYYEPPVGLDATIYLPKPDFRFKNDTNAHILVQGKVVGTKVIFELWGKGDGRSAAVTDPVILSTTPAGAPIYHQTDAMFVGEEKQLEKPHDGAVTTATYTVMRDGKVINKQTFKSVYKAWPAQFLVGTKIKTE